MSDDDKRQRVCAATEPMVVEVRPGYHYWCSCGRSKRQPLCDGIGHRGTPFAPTTIRTTEKTTIAFCMCRQSSTDYICDEKACKLIEESR